MPDIALVTGAGRGIGREVATQLAAAGLHVVVAARSPEAATEVAAATGGTPLTLDVTDPRSVAAAADAVRELDVLVNNAAAYPDWAETPLTADLDTGLEVAWSTNVVGAWRMVQAFAPALARARNPRVVNVASGAGSHGDAQYGLAAGPGMAPYAVTKAALGALTHKLATELPGARVNAVDPGLTATAPGMEQMGARPVPEGAAGIVWAATLGPDGPTGGFFRDGRPHPW